MFSDELKYFNISSCILYVRIYIYICIYMHTYIIDRHIHITNKNCYSIERLWSAISTTQYVTIQRSLMVLKIMSCWPLIQKWWFNNWLGYVFNFHVLPFHYFSTTLSYTCCIKTLCIIILILYHKFSPNYCTRIMVCMVHIFT